jgi:arylsulfatase A-like enzyme
VFVVSRFALLVLVRSSVGSSSHIDAILRVSLVAFYVAFAVALSIPRTRERLVTSLDGASSEKMTRRTALATVVGSATLVATEYALAKTAPVVLSAFVPQRTKSNFLLITFDALTAEDMSLYGYKLPTTPNIDAFARKATVFKNFYSASTFTTPCVATMLTGVYPSESHVYQLQGRLRAEYAKKKYLPHLMGAAGYATGAVISNPFAYYFARKVENGFGVLPDPRFGKGVLEYAWDATRPLHQDSGIGNRVIEYMSLQHALNSIGLLPTDASFRVHPSASFNQARELLAQLSNPYFLWVHVMAPHAPYLPDAADRGRFIADAELGSVDQETEKRWQPRYESDQQSQVNRIRLRYDEYIATADRAFGAFMSDLDSRGKLQDTTVILSADHGESFQGGVYQHESSYQTRPVIHVPLIIRTPGQQDGRTVDVTADQTSLAPTIIELAGQRKPDWMRGESLARWLDRDGQGEGEGLAFTQDLETSSVFQPVRRGSVGVISGDFQYVVYLSEQRGNLRPLRESASMGPGPKCGISCSGRETACGPACPIPQSCAIECCRAPLALRALSNSSPGLPSHFCCNNLLLAQFAISTDRLDLSSAGIGSGEGDGD